MARLLAVLLLLAVLCPASAQRGPDGQVLPTWLRLVDRDDAVYDFYAFYFDSITLCPTRGTADIWSQDDAAGTAIIETAGGTVQMQYSMRHYNEGGVTDNPNTTGDQLLLIEDVNVLFASGLEGCVRYSWDVPS